MRYKTTRKFMGKNPFYGVALLLIISISACTTPDDSTPTLPPITKTQPPTSTATPPPTPWPSPQVIPGALMLRRNFPGVDMQFIYGPDPELAVGENVVIVSTNERIAIYTKDGVQLSEAFLDIFFTPLKQRGEDTIFDPLILYDPWSQRFFLFARAKVPDPTCQLGECKAQLYIAVSKTSHPTNMSPADWYRYALDATVDL